MKLKRYRIDRLLAPDTREYVLLDDADIVVRTSHSPRLLSNWAFSDEGGADEVTHLYDLKKAEEEAGR